MRCVYINANHNNIVLIMDFAIRNHMVDVSHLSAPNPNHRHWLHLSNGHSSCINRPKTFHLLNGSTLAAQEPPENVERETFKRQPICKWPALAEPTQREPCKMNTSIHIEKLTTHPQFDHILFVLTHTLTATDTQTLRWKHQNEL